MKIGIILGDISGDKIAANLFKNFKNKRNLIGISGIKLKLSNNNKKYSLRDISAFGIFDPILKIKKIIKIKNKLSYFFLKNIEVFIGFDFAGLNLKIEKYLKQNGILTIHVISPAIWAWRSYRLIEIKKSTNLMMPLYKFEKILYNKKYIPVKILGHPYTDKIKKKCIKNTKIKLRIKKNVILLLPGSRYNEINLHVNIYKRLIQLYKYKKNIIFTTIICNKKIYKKITNNFKIQTYKKLYLNNFYKFLTTSNFIICASGTASLESLLNNKNLIVIYKLNKITFKIINNLIKLKYISLPNILHKKRLVNEYIQNKITKKNLINNLSKTYNNLLKKKYIYIINKLSIKLNKTTRFTFNKIINNFIFYK